MTWAPNRVEAVVMVVVVVAVVESQSLSPAAHKITAQVTEEEMTIVRDASQWTVS